MMDVILAVAWVIMVVSLVGLIIMCRRSEKMFDEIYESWDQAMLALLKTSAKLNLAEQEIERLKGERDQHGE